MTDWTEKETAVDGWEFFREALSTESDTYASELIIESLDNMQSAYWGAFGSTGEYVPGSDSLAALRVLVDPLAAFWATWSPFIHEQEGPDWQGWKHRFDFVLAAMSDKDLTDRERWLYVVAPITQGMAVASGDKDGIPLLAQVYTLIRASRAWHESDSAFLDALDKALTALQRALPSKADVTKYLLAAGVLGVGLVAIIAYMRGK